MECHKILLRVVALVMACFALEAFALFAFADDEGSVSTTEYQVPSETVVQEVSEMATEPVVTSEDNERTDNDNWNNNDIVSVAVSRSVSPVEPSEVNGLKKIFLQLIGNYDMVTTEYTYTSSNGYTSKQVTTEPDYAWMITAALFMLVLWSLFRFVGGLANGKR